MRHGILILLLVLFSACCVAAPTPTTMRMVDLRGITGQPELGTWLGSLQGVLNRQETTALVYLVRNDQDARLADALVSMYQLQREVLTPGALLALEKPSLTGQVRYDPAQPWTRNIALTAAALSPGMVLATDNDLGLPTVLDLRNRWANRREAYAWAVAQYGEQVTQNTVALAPESGHSLADLIVSQRLLALDYSPVDAQEATALSDVIAHLPAGGRLLGDVDDRCGDADAATWKLTQLLGTADQSFVQARDTANLSCLLRLPITRPLLQRRDEDPAMATQKCLVLIYDGGGRSLSGSQSLDYAANRLLPLLEDRALATVPVGVETPLALQEYAPALYQLLIARQQRTAAELIAAPNGDGWALPMAMTDAQPALQRAAARARAMDLTGISIFDTGGQQAYLSVLSGLASNGWQGALFFPIATKTLPDGLPRQSRVLPRFSALVSATRVHSTAELHATLAKLTDPFNVVYLDPHGVPPAALRAMLPEISADYTLFTPSQAFREVAEYAAVLPWLQAKQAKGVRDPKRGQPTLRVEQPQTTLTAPTAADPIPITVRISGTAPVLVARAIYQAPDGRQGAVNLHDDGDGRWSATLPPMLTGGTLAVRARVVEYGEFGITLSDKLTLQLPVTDSDADGAQDTLEAYQGTDPHNPDTDGDGLADGYDSAPTTLDRGTIILLAPVTPPTDRPVLADAGTSTVTGTRRLIPVGSAITYRLPLQDLPAAPTALRITTIGPGSVTVSGGTATPLLENGADPTTTIVPVTAAQMADKDLRVTLTAGDQPLTLCAIYLTSNPAGPYLQLPTLSPAAPPANTPILVRAIVYSQHTLKAVRLRYGSSTGQLATMEMGHLDGTAGAVFVAELPGQADGSILIYGIEAEDVDGNIAATPYRATPIGHTRKHSIALRGTRELQGTWSASSLWEGSGRVLTEGTGEDTFYFRGRPGTYTAWLLASPRERGVQVTMRHTQNGFGATQVILNGTVPAGSTDGWYKLGTFSVSNTDTAGSTISITPVGESGYCAYSTLVLTQDARFTPPLAYAPIDWYNSLTVSGIDDGQTVTGAIKLTIQQTGNIDDIRIGAEQRTAPAGVLSTDTRYFTKQRDGSYVLNTRGLNPGEYEISVDGMRILSINGTLQAAPLVTVTFHVVIPAQ